MVLPTISVLQIITGATMKLTALTVVLTTITAAPTSAFEPFPFSLTYPTQSRAKASKPSANHPKASIKKICSNTTVCTGKNYRSQKNARHNARQDDR
jgi:hypothetical protein